MKTGVVIPAKSFERAKSRLGPGLGPDARRALAQALFERALEAVAGVGFDHVLVLTDGESVARLAVAHRVLVLRDGGALPLATLVDAGLGALSGLGVERAVVLMADLPYVDAASLRALLSGLDDTDLVVAPDHRNEGTNALAVRLPAPPTQFGHDDSLLRHLRLELPRPPRLLRAAALALDVDLPADLAAWQAGARV